MLRILGNPKRACTGLTRREVLVAGGLGALGLGGGLQAYTPPSPSPKKVKSVICLFLFGGWSQLETFDMKPDAPPEVRGPYKAIASSIPGLPVCEHLPLLAQRMNQVALVRGVHSDDANHNTSLILSGRNATNGGTAVKGINPGIAHDWPFFMSALECIRDLRGETSARADFPQHLCVPNRLGLLEGYHRTGPYGGFLGARFDPVCTRFGSNGEHLFEPNGVKADTLKFGMDGAALGPDVTLDQLDKRVSLLEQLDSQSRQRFESPATERYGFWRGRALDLLSSHKFRKALDVKEEPAKLRERYGWNLFGQSVLLSRRLVEAGAPLVTAIWDCTKESQDISLLSWDTHWDHFKACEGWLLPGLDRALATLLDDLQSRRMLDETLVVVLSEMGRTPKINARAGRDHWVGSYCALFAGAGIKAGAVYGRSDKIASYVVEDGVSPLDLLATVYHLCGIPSDAVVHDQQRQQRLLYGDGAPIKAILT